MATVCTEFAVLRAADIRGGSFSENQLTKKTMQLKGLFFGPRFSSTAVKGCQNLNQKRILRCSISVREVETNPNSNVIKPRSASRTKVRFGLPSKGRMAEQTVELLQSCQLTLRKPNPRQYIANISEMEDLEVWFQRASDIVRKLKNGDIDLGIVGLDMVKEFGKDDDDLVVVHDALGFGQCYLAVAIPSYGIFESVNSLEDLLSMPQWTPDNPLRIVTGYTHLAAKFFQDKDFQNYLITTADGALEAAPAMGTADAILDLVSTGTTLKENNLKEIKGGKVLESQGVLVSSKKALLENKSIISLIQELIERFDAHLRAKNQFIVTANMTGESQEEVAQRIFSQTSFSGLEGPTVSKVYSKSKDGLVINDHFSVVVVVPKSQIYESIRQIRKAGGRGVLVSPVTYIFDEEPPRWKSLQEYLIKNKA